jgi:glycosyltransferase involved in cell wall biosynthesis
MNVLGIADATYVHTLKWANGLARRGHRLHLISWRDAPVASMAYRSEVDLDPRPLAAMDSRRPWEAIRSILRLRALHARLRPDLVHAHFLAQGAWLAALSGLRPLVVSVMGGDLVGPDWTSGSRMAGLLTPFTIKRSSLVVCWSRNLERMVKEIAGPAIPTAVIVGGIDRTLFRPGSPSSALRERLRITGPSFVVFSPRILWPHYNIETIVQGFALLRRERKDAVLVLVHYLAERFPDYSRKIDALISDLGLSAHVRSVPAIPNQEMPDYFRLASVTVSIPSSDGTPMTAMESLACGTPVVMGDLASYDPLVFGDSNTVPRVNPADPAGLSAVLLGLAADEGLRSRLAQGGLRIVEQHADEERELDRMESCYRSLLERGRS